MPFVAVLRLLLSRRFVERTGQSMFTGALFTLSSLLVNSPAIYAVCTCPIIVIGITGTVPTPSIQLGAVEARAVFQVGRPSKITDFAALAAWPGSVTAQFEVVLGFVQGIACSYAAKTLASGGSSAGVGETAPAS